MDTAVALAWDAPSSPVNGIVHYTLVRDGSIDRKVTGLHTEEKNLTPKTEYRFYVTATDSAGKESLPSDMLSVKTTGDDSEVPDPEYPEWKVGHSYKKGDLVTYQHKRYACRNAHKSQIDWAPGTVPTLWLEVVVK